MAGRWVAAAALLVAVGGVVWGVESGGARSAAPPPGTDQPHTLPGDNVPVLDVTHPADGASAGYIFIAEKGPKRTGGPLIVDNKGRVVWYDQLAPPLQTTDFRVQRYRGKPVLTWWAGTVDKAGVGKGSYVVYSTSYKQIARVRPKGGYPGDLHEFQLTPRGTAFITAYHEVPADLSSVGGPRQSYAYDCIVEEVDVATGRLVFEWHSIEHVPFSESVQANREPAKHATKKRPFDYFHVNSISDGPGGTILVSARNTSTIYLLARDGHIVWRLGGKHSDFGPAAAVKLAFQHNARLHPGGLLSVFDNGGIPRVERFSRPVVLHLDLATHRARIVKTFAPPKKIASPYEGNLQLLSNGGAVVGWGGVPVVSEFGPDGGLRFQLKLPYGDTYRAYRSTWRGRPATRPVAAAGDGKVYASWNGETGIARWQVLGGDDAAHLRVIGGGTWAGLETTLRADTSAKVVAVRALDAQGHVLGTSPTVGG
ncbi:MAG TPA: arylsulfotransferase family protein [Gaiellaceae bacterium]|nr:arylsulfotransferase family protein [Gaiellaceae bacterium]